MMGSWTNFLAMIKGPSVPSVAPFSQTAFNEKVLQFNDRVLKQDELQLQIDNGFREDIERLLGYIENSKRVELELLKRIEALEQRL